jgi:hypothetical protein
MSTADIRVEKGHAEPEEVAAITVLFLSRSARSGTRADVSSPGTASWRPHTFRAPHSWQTP